MGSSALTKIVRFDSKKLFFRIVCFGKIAFFGPKDRLLSSSRSSAFDFTRRLEKPRFKKSVIFENYWPILPMNAHF